MFANSKFQFSLVGLFCLLVCLPPAFFFYNNYGRFELVPVTYTQPESFKLTHSGYSPKLAYEFVERNLKNDECVLIFRQAEFAYYQSKCVITYADPKLLPFYDESSDASAADFLMSLNIKFVAIPLGYGMAEINHSQMDSILHNKKLSQLVLSSESFQVYELTVSDQQRCAPSSSVSRVLNSTDFEWYGGPISERILVSGGADPYVPPRALTAKRYARKTKVRTHAVFDGTGFYGYYSLDYKLAKLGPISYWLPSYTLLWEGLVLGETHAFFTEVKRKGDSSESRYILKNFRSADDKKKIIKSIEMHSEAYEHCYSNSEASGYYNLAPSSWSLSSKPSKRVEYIDWGQVNASPDSIRRVWANVLNDRDYSLSHITKIPLDSNSLRVSSSSVVFSGDAVLYSQWLRTRKAFKPWLTALEDKIFRKSKYSKIEKIIGGDFVSHLYVKGYSEYEVASTEIFIDVEKTGAPFSKCIAIDRTADACRLALPILRNRNEAVQKVRKLEIENLSVSFFKSDDCR